MAPVREEDNVSDQPAIEWNEDEIREAFRGARKIPCYPMSGPEDEKEAHTADSLMYQLKRHNGKCGDTLGALTCDRERRHPAEEAPTNHHTIVAGKDVWWSA